MYYFIVNPTSRTDLGMKVWESAEKELKRQKAAYAVYFTEYPHHSVKLAKQICRRAAAQGATPQDPCTIVVLGGDGTANEVLASIPDLDCITFAYLPSGSGNDLARGLGITSDTALAVRRILSGRRVRLIDYGNVFPDGKQMPHRFAVSAGIGFDASICEEALHSPIKRFLNKLRLGKLSYLFIAVKQLIAYHTTDMTVTFDGKTTKTYRRVFFLTAMNQKYEGGGLAVAPDADPADGKLTVCIIHDFPKIKAAVLIPALMLGGRHTHFKGIDQVTCTRVEIQAARPLCVHSDGEHRGYHSHVTFACSPKPMRMSV